MESYKLSIQTKVPLRSVWPDEARDFTPWLAKEENLALLGDVLDLELSCEGIEIPVGPYRADLICKDNKLKQLVLIENQLSTTDHSHLGQLITYAAGYGISTVIWIAERFTQEHQAALEKLNRDSSQGVNYFGIEIELNKIDDSLPAPRFNVVVKPNDWSRAVSASVRHSNLSEMRETQMEYWTAFKEVLNGEKGIYVPSPQPQNYMSFKIGKSFVSITTKMVSEDGSICVELYLSGKNAKKNFQALVAIKEKIESDMNESLEWEEHPENGPHKILLKAYECSLHEKVDWKRQHNWLREKLCLFNRIFRPLCRQLITN